MQRSFVQETPHQPHILNQRHCLVGLRKVRMLIWRLFEESDGGTHSGVLVMIRFLEARQGRLILILLQIIMTQKEQ